MTERNCSAVVELEGAVLPGRALQRKTCARRLACSLAAPSFARTIDRKAVGSGRRLVDDQRQSEPFKRDVRQVGLLLCACSGRRTLQ